jgi:RHS repeat-associated protein
VLGVSAEKPGLDYRGYVRDNAGALVGTRVPEGSPVVKKRYYYLRDALGSVVAMTNDAGTVVRRHVYRDPYGEDVSNDTVVTGAPSNPYRFAGEYFDTETSLYKMGERYYDPSVARWTQGDPLNQAFSPREANGYAYVGGDPVNGTGPTGMHACDQLGPHAL